FGAAIGNVTSTATTEPLPGELARALLSIMYGEDRARASANALFEITDGLFHILSVGRFSEIDLLLGSADVTRLAPEFLVGLLRVTGHDATSIPSWTGFLHKTQIELKARDLNPDTLLAGLV